MIIEFTRERGGFVLLPFIAIGWAKTHEGFMLLAWGQWLVVFKRK